MGSGTPDPISVAVALGSNLGDRERYLRDAVAALVPFIAGLRISSFYETDPVGVGDQPQFLNAVAVGTTTLSPRLLVRKLLDIEAELGRTRPHPGAARTLDLDLILYGNEIIEERDLIVPHPRFRDRRFVLEPLAEIAPEWIDPVTGRSSRQLLSVLLP